MKLLSITSILLLASYQLFYVEIECFHVASRCVFFSHSIQYKDNHHYQLNKQVRRVLYFLKLPFWLYFDKEFFFILVFLLFNFELHYTLSSNNSMFRFILVDYPKARDIRAFDYKNTPNSSPAPSKWFSYTKYWITKKNFYSYSKIRSHNLFPHI